MSATNNTETKRLKEIQRELAALLKEAAGLVRKASKKHPVVYERAQSYWLAHAETALGPPESYETTMGLTIEELEAVAAGRFIE